MSNKIKRKNLQGKVLSKAKEVCYERLIFNSKNKYSPAIELFKSNSCYEILSAQFQNILCM